MMTRCLGRIDASYLQQQIPSERGEWYGNVEHRRRPARALEHSAVAGGSWARVSASSTLAGRELPALQLMPSRSRIFWPGSGASSLRSEAGAGDEVFCWALASDDCSALTRFRVARHHLAAPEAPRLAQRRLANWRTTHRTAFGDLSTPYTNAPAPTALAAMAHLLCCGTADEARTVSSRTRFA
jgi:hypothetical protein